ncbi:hypothetical protein QBC41DRAFT_311721 [Cercophora samala]|uniref:Uncharacterized protein n=1 Tax=Cercophora samala TaxID=330535 RepID=A0AA40DEA9_9PEZI|nr:hypothetical protein QBC41DRAFT_311721 [Cercophora samala]
MVNIYLSAFDATTNFSRCHIPAGSSRVAKRSADNPAHPAIVRGEGVERPISLPGNTPNLPRTDSIHQNSDRAQASEQEILCTTDLDQKRVKTWRHRGPREEAVRWCPWKCRCLSWIGNLTSAISRRLPQASNASIQFTQPIDSTSTYLTSLHPSMDVIRFAHLQIAEFSQLRYRQSQLQAQLQAQAQAQAQEVQHLMQCPISCCSEAAMR